MAVPDTTTFSLQDVITELGLATDDGLEECFANANASGFDDAYEGSKNGLLNFRNYTHQIQNTLVFLHFSSSSSSGACSSSTNHGRYVEEGKNFSTTSYLYQYDDAYTFAGSGYYEKNGLWRYWNGNSFTSSGSCS